MALATSCHSSSPTLRRHGGHISAQRCERPQAAAAGGTEAPGRPGVRALRVGQGTHCTAAGTAPARPRAPRRAARIAAWGGLTSRPAPRAAGRPPRSTAARAAGPTAACRMARPWPPPAFRQVGLLEPRPCDAIAFSTRKEVGTPNCTGRSIDIGLDPNQTPGCSSSVPCEPPTKLLRWIQGCNLSRKNRISTGFQNRAISPPASTKMSKFCALVPGPGPAFNGSPCGLL